MAVSKNSLSMIDDRIGHINARITELLNAVPHHSSWGTAVSWADTSGTSGAEFGSDPAR